MKQQEEIMSNIAFTLSRETEGLSDVDHQKIIEILAANCLATLTIQDSKGIGDGKARERAISQSAIMASTYETPIAAKHPLRPFENHLRVVK